MHSPRILVEIPPNPDFEKAFRRLYEKATVQRFRRAGMNRAASKRAARSFLAESRKVFRSRFPLSPQPDV